MYERPKQKYNGYKIKTYHTRLWNGHQYLNGRRFKIQRPMTTLRGFITYAEAINFINTYLA